MFALVDDDVMLGFRFQAMLWFSPPMLGGACAVCDGSVVRHAYVEPTLARS